MRGAPWIRKRPRPEASNAVSSRQVVPDSCTSQDTGSTPGPAPVRAPPTPRTRYAPGPKGSGIGLRNVHQRIRLTFGGGYGLSIHSEPDAGTRVRVRLPALDGAAAAPYRKEVAP